MLLPAPLLALLALLASGSAGAEMVHRDHFKELPVEEALARRAPCGAFAGNPDLLVFQLVTMGCTDPGARWEVAEVDEVQMTRAWAKLGYMSYQVLLLGLADDSVAAEEWRFELSPLDETRWQLDFAGLRWRCRPGRGADEDFTTQLCN